MPGSIEERIQRARRRYMVGRDEERALFAAALDAAEPPFAFLYVFGPGGVGKTSLLRMFCDLCAERGIGTTTIDCRALPPTPDAFVAAVRACFDLAPESDPGAALPRQERHVLLIDTFEAVEPLQDWLRETFLPRLPENVTVVLAGRQPPPVSWRSDPGWQSLTRVVSLRNLSPDESGSFLQRRGVPVRHHDRILRFTHGHPLALTLVADVFDQRGDIASEPETAPDIVQALLERFAQKVPGPAHQVALEACAVVRVLTEPLLARLLEGVASPESARELFDWLRGLSFIESGARGLFPHDLAREALLADLRWRNPDRYGDIHRRARNYYRARWAETCGAERQRVLFDFMFLHRDSAIVRTAFAWYDAGGIHLDGLRSDDLPALQAMTREHEGEASAALLVRWAQRRPDQVTVLRETSDGSSPPVGFMVLLELDSVDDADREADPATARAWRYLERTCPLRSGERVTYLRFWMAQETYQAVSSAQSLILVDLLRRCVSLPKLAYTFFPCADPDLWEPLLGYAEMRRLPEADFTVGGRTYGVFGNDWRVLSPAAWLDLLAEKETAEGRPVASPRSETLLVLSEPEFACAVREALRHFTQPTLLRANPLLRSRVVARNAPAVRGDEERAEALQALLREAVESLQTATRSGRAYGPVKLTFLEPLPSQEAAADRLDLPFSTYRRHLAEGIAAVTEALWRQEIDGGTK